MSSAFPDRGAARVNCSWQRVALCAMFALSLTACEREVRRIRELGPANAPSEFRPMTSQQAGPAREIATASNPYEANAFAIAEGKRLYLWYNCNGCHAQGGGAIGPPLMDDRWIYGAAPENIFATIVEGRPNGMPSFGGRIPDYQVWQLVAYVQSLSGHVRKDAAPGRADHMQVRQRELAIETQPVNTQKGRRP